MQLSDQPSITCPICGKTSFHPRDISDHYCGYCHWWTGDPKLLESWLEEHAVANEVPKRLSLSRPIIEAIVRMLPGR